MLLRRRIVGIGAGMGIILAACGGGSNGGGNPLQPGPAVAVDTVNIIDNAFGPQSVTIIRGGTVTWTWASTNTMQHNVNWAAGPVIPPASPTQATGAPFNLMFADAGTYEFVCTLHAGMAGTVFVE